MKTFLALFVIIALFASPVLAEEETLFLYSGTDTLNDTENLYETIGTWGDATLTIDYVETGPFNWNPHEAVSPFDTSTIIINDGLFDGYVGAPYNFGAYDIDDDGDTDGATGSNLILNGGTYNFRIGSSDGVMHTTINGGTFQNLYDSSTARIGGSTLTVTGGDFYGSVKKNDLRISGGNMLVSGGTFHNGVRVDANDTTTISGGTWDGGRLYFINNDNNNGVTHVTGGDFSNMEKWGMYKDYGEVHISGGDFSNVLSEWTSEYMYQQPVFHFYGQDFEATFLGSEDEELFGMVLSRTYYYQVTGTLCDGNTFLQYGSFENDFQDGQDVGAPIFNFHECAVDPDPIPEPTTVALLGLGALGLVGARRRRK